MTLCACGKPLHYNDPAVQRLVEDLVKELGATIKVTGRRGSYRVQRHYLALHGITEEELVTLYEQGIIELEK